MRQAWLPAKPENAARARAIVRDAAAELRLEDDVTWQLMLATTEAFANAVEHGAPCNPRGIELRLELRTGRLEVEVRDCGCFPKGARTLKEPGEGGRGIPLIAAIMDHVEVVPGTGTTRVRFDKRLSVA
jgi:serine/threonine-protein kinase RsbW